jgi:hypothetical protein
MKGLKIAGGRKRRTPHDCALGYSFRDLVEPIQASLSEFCWALQGTQVFVAEASGETLPHDDVLDAMFELQPGVPAPQDVDTAVWEAAWLKPGCLEKLAALVVGDWTDIVGVSYPPHWSRAAVRPDDNVWLAKNASVYFACIDAAFWEVYAQDQGILETLMAVFPESEPRALKDKDY